MLRLISSLLVLLLGSAASPARAGRSRSPLRTRARQRPDHDGVGDRTFEVPERPRAKARARQWRWAGAVEIVYDTHTEQVPGTWTLEDVAFQQRVTARACVDALPLPSLTDDSTAWVGRTRAMLELREPGTRVRVGHVDTSGWRTLEVAVPTHPPTVLEVDRAALGAILGGAASMRLRINA